MKKFIYFSLLLIYLLTGGTVTAHASVFCAPTPLGGFSKIMEDYVDAGQKLYDNEDLQLLSEVMYHENGSNSDKCILYTGSVVLNRVATEGYPDTIHGVLYQKGQYSTVPLFFTKPIPTRITKLAKELLIFGSQLPEPYIYQAMFPQGKHQSEAIKVDTEWFCRR